MREFSELPHFVEHRLNAASAAAARYCAQFPSHLTAAVAGFVAYVAAALAGVLIAVMLAHDMLVERTLAGHTFVWWGAALGVVVAAARGATGDECPAHDPEAAMLEVVRHTHWLPRHWRGRAHTREVQVRRAVLRSASGGTPAAPSASVSRREATGGLVSASLFRTCHVLCLRGVVLSQPQWREKSAVSAKFDRVSTPSHALP